MPSCSRLRAASLILACAVFLFGCGSDGPAAESDWTIQEGTSPLGATVLTLLVVPVLYQLVARRA